MCLCVGGIQWVSVGVLQYTNLNAHNINKNSSGYSNFITDFANILTKLKVHVGACSGAFERACWLLAH